MDKKVETILDSAAANFTPPGVELRGIVVCDKSGLVVTSKDVSISPGPVACLAELAGSLLGQPATVCLEHNENQVLVRQADAAVVAFYTKSMS